MSAFRCDYCGEFISYADMDAGRATTNMITPDSFCTSETWETYHLRCNPPYVAPTQAPAKE